MDSNTSLAELSRQLFEGRLKMLHGSRYDKALERLIEDDRVGPAQVEFGARFLDARMDTRGLLSLRRFDVYASNVVIISRSEVGGEICDDVGDHSKAIVQLLQLAHVEFEKFGNGPFDFFQFDRLRGVSRNSRSPGRSIFLDAALSQVVSRRSARFLSANGLLSDSLAYRLHFTNAFPF